METLDTIGLRTGTDKSSAYHGYLDIYERYLKNVDRSSCGNLLEIGIFKGQSIKMWKEYFPNFKICAIDIDPKTMMENVHGVETFLGSQSDKSFLKKVSAASGGFDVIIDDGSHVQEHQQVSFGFLFGFLNRGGLYIIEDLMEANSRRWKTYNPTATKKITSVVFRGLKQNNKVDSDFISTEESKYIEDNFSFCDVVKAKKSEVAFIGKK